MYNRYIATERSGHFRSAEENFYKAPPPPPFSESASGQKGHEGKKKPGFLSGILNYLNLGDIDTGDILLLLLLVVLFLESEDDEILIALALLLIL